MNDRLRYMPQLDSLRAGAVMVVMLWHFTSRETPLREFAVNTGVRLFFVLSGFLITSILLNSRDRCRAGTLTLGDAAKSFYVRRALRIMPIYYGTLIVAAAFHVRGVAESFWWFAAYLADIRLAATNATTTVSHFWSLAVEEQFYLVWPWIVLGTTTRQLRRVCLAAVVIAPVFRLLMLGIGHPRFGDLLMFGQLDGLGAGALMGICKHEQRLDTAARRSLYGLVATVAVVAALFMPALVGQPLVAVLVPTAVVCVLVPIVAYAAIGVRGVAGRILDLRAVRYVGIISYGAYVYHPFMSDLVPALGRMLGLAVPPMGVASVLTLIGASLVVASASWHFIEQPIRHLRTRLT